MSFWYILASLLMFCQLKLFYRLGRHYDYKPLLVEGVEERASDLF
jgi:hypothetical protein